MPGTLLARTISGDGVDSLSGSEVYFAIVHIGTMPHGIRELESANPDHILRAGWVSFGASLASIGGINRDYWREVWFLDFVDSMFTPSPSTFTGPTSLTSDRIRWHIGPGGSANLYVFGT